MVQESTFLSRVFAVLALLASAAPGADKPTELQLSASFYGRAADELSNASRIAGTEIGGDVRHHFSPSLLGRVWLGVQLEAGSSQAYYTTDNQPQRQARLREASLDWSPWETVHLAVGALSQDDLEIPTLLAVQTFPGFRQSGQWEAGPFYFGAQAEQTVPTANLLTDGPSLRQGSLSAFFLERVLLGVRPAETVRLETHLSHFAFDNLPESVAYQSRFYGNTVRGAGASQSEFAYGFRGYEIGALLGFDGSHFTPTVRASWTTNPDPPSGSAFSVDFRPRFRLGQSTWVTPRAQYFHVDADAAPAYYNDKELGHNNRRGYRAGLELDFGEGWLVGTQATYAQVLQSSPYQAELHYFLFYFRSVYDVL
jgi:hypothetical protein